MAQSESQARQAVIEVLNVAFSMDEVEEALRRHWSQNLLHLIAAGPNPRQLKYDYAKIHSVLLEPVEAFIAGVTDEIKDKFSRLKADDLPSFLCNKSFRAGEPTYSCRDCAVDSTCVLCIDCFKQSPHRTHRYKISSSNGGGYCDCGDPEAWKKDFACDQHKPPDDLKDINFNLEHARSRVPKDISARFQAIIKHSICYVYQVLTYREGTSVLPDDLTCPQDLDDPYPFATILYNDEVHTYENVISTLSLTLECTPDDSLEYATVVDHEGRSPVKFGTAAECDRVKKFVERNSKRPQPLRLDVVKTSVYAHQVLALFVMRWIQDLANECEGFKALICDVCFQFSAVPGSMQIVSSFLLEDVRLWKAARKACHALFMDIFLVFNDAKIEFSRLLACLYPQLMTAFILDDHDHGDSCISLTVQLFTVPTVARTLMADGLVEVIMRSFVMTCKSRQNADGRLVFDRSTQPSHATQFKRALHTLSDAKYFLNTIPSEDQWNSALRKGFIGTFEQFVEIMVMMEGMDSHTRRTQSHVEYEADWEPAFNVQLRMGSIIDLLQQWCASDDYVLSVCLEKLLASAIGARVLGTLDKVVKKEVARQTFECIEYDVGTQVVSIHHPVVRLLAGLLVHGMERKVSIVVEPTKARMLIDECLRVNARELLELPLRTMVLVAQASAGMWRRNGYALANQIFFYQQPRCREEMMDKDIIMMQACAAVMPPDSFLIALLDKFGLVGWADETFDATPVRTEDDSIRQVMFLAEEFLYGLIILVGERFYPNVGRVTHDDCLRNEIIHQLCKESMAYSELMKYLPDQEAKSTTLDDSVKDVAIFKKTSPTSKGIFELKPEFNNRYNMFFYHYTRIEHSKAEDTQRKRMKKVGVEVVFAPPCPPEFTDAFNNIIHLLDCNVFINLLNLTVRRALISHPRSFSEGQLVRMLFLVGYGLHEEKRQRNPGRSYTLKFIEKAEDADVFTTIRQLMKRTDNESYKGLMEWILQFYEELTVKEDHKMDISEEVAEVKLDESESPDSESDDIEERRRKAAKRSEKMLQQLKSAQTTLKLCMAESPGSDSDDIEEKKRKAAARRERIMQQMKYAQTTFASQNSGELKEIALPEDATEKLQDLQRPDQPRKETMVTVGAGRTLNFVTEDTEEKHTCILCSESHSISLKADSFVAVAYVQRSTVFSQEDRNQFSARFLERPATSLKDICQGLLEDANGPVYTKDTLPCAPHVSSCGHLLHSKCWKTYFDSVVARERRRSIRLRTNNGGSFDVTKNEFRCPLCSRLCNAAIPLCPLQLTSTPETTLEGAGVVPTSNDIILALEALFSQTENKPKPCNSGVSGSRDLKDFLYPYGQYSDNFQHPAIQSLRSSTAKMERLLGIDVKDDELVSSSYAEAIRTFNNQVYQMTMNVLTVEDESRCVGLNWSACSYSIQSIEMCLRIEKKSLMGSFSSRQFLCIKSLIRATCWSSAAYEPKVLMDYAINLYTTIFSDVWQSPASRDLRNVFQMDALTLLVNLTCAFPWLPWTKESLNAPSNDVLICRPPGGDVFDHTILTVVYLLHVLQVLVHLPEETTEPDLSIPQVADWRMVYSLFNGKPPPANLEQLVRRAVWPFLRCAALFYHFMTGIAAPESLKRENQTTSGEYDDLMTYLALSLRFEEITTNNPALLPLTRRWTLLMASLVKNKIQLSIHPRPCPHLAPLPRDFIDIINRASQYSGCKVEMDDRRSPAAVFNLRRSTLLSEHVLSVQAGRWSDRRCLHLSCHDMWKWYGNLSQVRENQILMIHGPNKGCFTPSPYVDEYGEPDPFLRRGNPLHLSQERMDQLLRHYLHHDLADEISHAMDQKRESSRV